jgi:T5orf172 domain
LPKHAIGFVYVMSNKAMPGILKVGWTAQLAEDRAKALHDTGVPLPFEVEFRAATSHYKAAEKKAKALLKPSRVTPDREFFRTLPSKAIAAVQEALLSTASIAAWDSEQPHKVKHGDRIALTTEAGDLFVVLTYPDLMAPRAQPTDLWQAHSDGDLLELMGTSHPGPVAGFSDDDPGSDTDPVPYLDRAHKAPNGSINGRERLVPGERLLWFRPMAGGECCEFVMFEIEGYCQVISRTWDPKFSADGCPLLLNTPTYDELPLCIARGTRAALLMAPPRTWAPRTPNPEDGWAALSGSPQPPEYWLTQLNLPERHRGHR